MNHLYSQIGSSIEMEYSVIHVDISTKSNWDWNAIVNLAEIYKKNDEKIIWQIDLGDDHNPLDLTRTATIRLALESFVNVIKDELLNYTLGFILYFGPFPFADMFSVSFDLWKERNSHQQEFFLLCDLLLPKEYERFILIENCNESIEDRIRQASALEIGAFAIILFEGEVHIHHEWKLENKKIAKQPFFSTAICLPSPSEKNWGSVPWEMFVQKLQTQKTNGNPSRFIQERFLHEQWDLLDDIWFLHSNPSLDRMIQGFIAAGGRVHNLIY